MANEIIVILFMIGILIFSAVLVEEVKEIIILGINRFSFNAGGSSIIISNLSDLRIEAIPRGELLRSENYEIEVGDIQIS